MKKFENKVGVAMSFATLMHAGTGQRYGDQPYSVHLTDVYHVLLRYDVTDKDVLAAGCLHDVIEDTGVSPETINELFGARVRELVEAVTDAPGENRKARKAATYPKIRAAGHDAITVKLADRIANVEHAIAACNLRTWKMYRKEQPEFMAQLRQLFVGADGTVEQVALQVRMWETLDQLFSKAPAPPPPAPVSLEV